MFIKSRITADNGNILKRSYFLNIQTQWGVRLNKITGSLMFPWNTVYVATER